MQLQTILNRLYKHKSFVYETARWTKHEGADATEVRVRPRANSRPICSGCGRKRPGYDCLTERRYQFVPLWGLAVFFRYAPRRVECPDCGVSRVMRSRLEPMKRVAKMLRRHQELILNWFRAKGTISSGVVEGLNYNAKLTMKKAYGFRTELGIELALYHRLGALPEPEFTHRFW